MVLVVRRKLKALTAIEDMSPKDLNAYDILESKTVKLEFEGGVTVEGEIVTGSRLDYFDTF
jgi:hypothetical protein